MGTDSRDAVLKIGTAEHLTGRLYRVHFSRAFLEECRRGTPYSVTEAAEIRKRPGLLDMYLAVSSFLRAIEGLSTRHRGLRGIHT